MIHPRLDHAAMVWSPSAKKSIRKLERIQRATTKLPPSLKDLPYQEILSKLAHIIGTEKRER